MNPISTPDPARDLAGDSPDHNGAEPLAEVTFVDRFSRRLAAEELYYRSTNYPLLDRILAGLFLGLGVIAVLRVGLVWWSVIWFPLAASELLGLSAALRLAIGLLIRPAQGLGLARTVTATEKGLSLRWGDSQFDLPWGGCRMLLEDGRTLLLAWGAWRYLAIPKEAFAADQDLDRMRRILLTRIPAATRTSCDPPG